MSKQKLFVDFDGTLTASTKAFVDTYNLIYQNHPEFKFADYTQVQRYNFEDQCPLVDNALDIFDHELFFKNLEFINDNTYKILDKLNEKYQLIIVSIGTPLNLAYKSLFLENKLPFIKDYVLLRNDGCVMNKSIVNMEGSIFIDDIPSNLESVQCENKILFGEIYPWNEYGLNKFKHCLTWSDVEELLL